MKVLAAPFCMDFFEKIYRLHSKKLVVINLIICKVDY